VTIKGVDDTAWLAWRSADSWPASYPYSTEVLIDVPKRYYRLGESSGTVAADSSTSAQNGTYTGGKTLGVAGGIEDTNTAVTWDGFSGFVSVPIAGLPTGNAIFSMACWVKVPSYQLEIFTYLGNAASSAVGVGAFLQLTNTGLPAFGVWGQTAFPATPISTGVWHFLVGTYDLTNFNLYVDGVLSATIARSVTVNLPAGVATVGAASSTLGYYVLGSQDETAFYSTVMIAYANVNAGPGALAKRQVSNLTMAADPSVGGQVTGVARGDVLLDIEKNLALQSGDNIGFYIRQTLATGPNTMAFTTYAPSDKTSNAIFSDEIGNLQDYSFSLDMPTANVVTVGDGTQTGLARVFLEVPDAASVTSYGRIEGFAQGAASQDYQTMLNAGTAQLLTTKAASTLSITPVDTVGLQYQRDYNLGDKVSVFLEGQTIQDKLREVRISLTKGSGAGSPDEVITPAIGPVDVTMAAPSMISNLTKKNLRAQARLNKIERNR